METIKSAAHDTIDAIAIKTGILQLAKPITYTINLSISQSKFPARWKIGAILPLHKGKGLSQSDPSSFRPITLLPILGKLTEKVLQSQIMNFMTASKQLNQNHHSYRSGHSTATTMLQLSNEIFESCNDNLITTLITLDQSSAFDMIKHEILIEKLKLYKFNESATEWIRSYLNYRSQYIKIGTRKSSFWSTERGVPQGSVLGPILYVLYTNELPDIIKDDNCLNPSHENHENLFTENCRVCGTIPTYADDATYVIATRDRFTAQEKITKNTKKIKLFLEANGLSINLGKADILEVMVRQKRIYQRGAPPQISVTTADGNLKTITAGESCRLLGANLNMGHDVVPPSGEREKAILNVPYHNELPRGDLDFNKYRLKHMRFKDTKVRNPSTGKIRVTPECNSPPAFLFLPLGSRCE